MNEAPSIVWIDEHGTNSEEWEVPSDVEYIRADIVDGLRDAVIGLESLISRHYEFGCTPIELVRARALIKILAKIREPEEGDE